MPSSKHDDAWNETQLRFDTVVRGIGAALPLRKALPDITLARSLSTSLSARVRLDSPGHVVVEFGSAFLKRLHRSVADVDDSDLAALVLLDYAEPAAALSADLTRVALYAIAEQFVLHHELFHVLGGHLEQHIASSQGRSLQFDETTTAPRASGSRRDETLTSEQELALYRELEADNSALQFLTDRCSIGDVAAALKATPATISEHTGGTRTLAFRLLFAGVWLVLLALEVPKRRRRQAGQEHPWPAARLMSLLFTLMPHYVEGSEVREDELGQRFVALSEGTAALSKQYMMDVVRQALKFVIGQADGDQVVARYRSPDPAHSDLFADVLLDLHGLIFDGEVRSPGGQQLLALFKRRRFYAELFSAHRYFADGALG